MGTGMIFMMPMSHQWIPLFLVVATFVLVGCGDDEISTEHLTQVQLVREKPPHKPSMTTANGESTPSVSREEAVMRKRAEQAIEVLNTSKDPDELAETLSNLATFGPKALIARDAVLGCIAHEEPFVRGLVVQALGKIDPVNSRDSLLKALDDPEDQVRIAAMLALTESNLEDLSPIYEHIAAELSARVQHAGMVLLSTVAPPTDADRICGLIPDLQPSGALVAVRFLQQHGGISHAEAISKLLHQGFPDLRVAVAQCLEVLKSQDRDILLALADAIVDEDLAARAAAARTLKSLCGEQVLVDPNGNEDALRRAREDWKIWIREKK